MNIFVTIYVVAPSRRDSQQAIGLVRRELLLLLLSWLVGRLLVLILVLALEAHVLVRGAGWWGWWHAAAWLTVAGREGIVVRLQWWLVYRGRMWNACWVLTWIQLVASLAALCTRFRVVTGGCTGVDVARASPSVELTARDCLVLRGAFEGSCQVLHLVIVSMVVSL